MAVEQNETQFLTDELHFPRTAFNQSSFLSKENLIKLGYLNTKQREVLVRAVKQVNWLFLITESNTNISAYHGSDININEIDYFIVELKSGDQVDDVAELVLKTVPKASIIELFWDDIQGKRIYKIGMAEYVRARGTDNLLSANRIHVSYPVSNRSLLSRYLNFQEQNQLDLKNLYFSFLDNIEKQKFEVVHTQRLKKGSDASTLNKRVEELQKQITAISNAAKKERQVGKRVALISKARKLQDIINKHVKENTDNE